jgi:phytol kinase
VTMYPYLAPLLAVALVAYCAIVFKRKSDLVWLAAFLAVGILLAHYEGADAGAMLIGIALFSSIAATLGSNENYAMVAVAAAYFAVFGGTPALVAQAALLGFLSHARSFSGKNSARDKPTERRRDVVQIAIGVIVVAVFAVASYGTAEMFLLAALLVGLLLSNYAVSNPKARASRLLLSLERKNAVFGQGAMWLALGALIAISFLNRNEAIALLASIFMADAVATLVGTRYGRHALPYNRKKSAEGSAAYFAVALLVSFPFLGYAAVLVALVAATVESLPALVDDNFDTAVALSVLMLLIGYFGLI